jgi:hypothetical protein
MQPNNKLTNTVVAEFEDSKNAKDKILNNI